MGSIKKSTFNIVRRPMITEKAATAGSQNNGVVFEVHPAANKLEIKNAIEKIFNVKVASVRTVNCLGKVKRVRNHSGQQGSWKKAYISLEKGHSIDVIEGL